jgi:AraC-like DNA-binding protein
MKKRNETPIENIFNVEALVSLYHSASIKVPKNTTALADRDHSVMYDFWQLFYVESGAYNVQMEDCPPQHMEQGQILLCEPHKMRTSRGDSDATVGIINIRCHSPKMKHLKNRVFTLAEEERQTMLRLLEGGAKIFRSLPEGAELMGQQPLEGTTDYQLQVFKNHIELLLIGLYARSMTEELAPSVQNQLNYYEQKFRMIVDFMKENLYRSLTVEEICAHTGFSLNTVKRIIHQQAGCGAIHYFLKLKIKEAKRLLGETELTVTQISDQLGFSSVHYFSKTFKRFVGVSPREYAYSLG